VIGRMGKNRYERPVMRGGSQSSVVPTSRTGLRSILPPTWDDPPAREASNGEGHCFLSPLLTHLLRHDFCLGS
jgi:hypothetical protein